MPKKLLMNKDTDDGTIILCKNYSPNGQPFYLWQDKMIDWDKYELYINVDITNITKEWQHILTISSTDIISWSGIGKLHLYGSPTHVRLQVMNEVFATNDFELLNYNKKNLQIAINKNGLYLSEKLMSSISSNWTLSEVMRLLKTSNVIIGSAAPGDYSVCTYNLVCLRKYQERGDNSVR